MVKLKREAYDDLEEKQEDRFARWFEENVSFVLLQCIRNLGSRI